MLQSKFWFDVGGRGLDYLPGQNLDLKFVTWC